MLLYLSFTYLFSYIFNIFDIKNTIALDAFSTSDCVATIKLSINFNHICLKRS